MCDCAKTSRSEINNDLISRSTLIEKLSKNSIFSRITNAEGKNVLGIIQEMPTIQTTDKESHKPTTNRDWLRSLNDSELAKQFVIPRAFIQDGEGYHVYASRHCGDFNIEIDAIKAEIKWLKRERGENE